ncbi:hypothetical protein DSO57_1004853 [Entomophthora muscae]|uniref:Uncharacterized protein n=1 Tax=Entomophthora muscae TaxID=34485 RepID=A0ACC2RYZ9_9FUNG|nr:hypothetical protein DSO57_1004853 [Entomophthora muscae]
MHIKPILRMEQIKLVGIIDACPLLEWFLSHHASRWAEMDEQHLFNWVLLTIGTLAVMTNLLLLCIARQLRNHTSEIKFAMLLALVDMGLGILIVCTSLLNTWFDNGFETFCKIKGPIDFLLLYLSPVLVAIIAMERYCKVRGTTISSSTWAAMAMYTVAYSSLIALAAAQSEFSTSLSGCDCTPIATNSLISAAVLFMLGFSMFLSLIVAIFSYLRILCFINVFQINKTYNPLAKRTKVYLRVITICLIYLLLIAPASILIMLEGSRNSNESNVLNITVSLLVAMNDIANPCLILFAHSLIFDQLKSSFQAESHSPI